MTRRKKTTSKPTVVAPAASAAPKRVTPRELFMQDYHARVKDLSTTELSFRLEAVNQRMVELNESEAAMLEALKATRAATKQLIYEGEMLSQLIQTRR